MKIKLDIECQSCRGTGVYVGIAEKDGAAVVCYTCKGTGCEKYSFTYEPFKGRKERKGVSRVYKNTYGFCIAPKVLTLQIGGDVQIDFSKEGVSYQEFLKGKMPEHIKTFACPMMADQSACHNKKGFVDICHEKGMSYGGFISKCSYQHNKKECWERFKK